MARWQVLYCSVLVLSSHLGHLLNCDYKATKAICGRTKWSSIDDTLNISPCSRSWLALQWCRVVNAGEPSRGVHHGSSIQCVIQTGWDCSEWGDTTKLRALHYLSWAQWSWDIYAEGLRRYSTMKHSWGLFKAFHEANVGKWWWYGWCKTCSCVLAFWHTELGHENNLTRTIQLYVMLVVNKS